MKKNYTSVQSPYSLKSNLLTILLLFQSFFLSLYATPYTVTSTTDGNATNQLRGAINAANGTVGPHTITVNAGTYMLGSTITVGNLANQDITIVAATGATPIIDISNIDRIFIFNIDGLTSGIKISLSGFILRNSKATSDTYGGGAILAGGPSNTYTISNCTFQNNTASNTGINTNGGALAFTGGGAVSINNCTFASNSAPGLSGGAVYFDLRDGYSGSLLLTNSTFSNNTANSVGGALSVNLASTLSTATCNVVGNNFLNNRANSVSSSGGGGGAIHVANEKTSVTPTINYNRFSGNTCANVAYNAVSAASSSGNINLTNNWWGCNGGPTACTDRGGTIGSGGTGTNTFTPFLVLRTVAANSAVCVGATTSVTSDFTINSAGTTIAASNLSAFNGVGITFSAASGSVSPTSTTLSTSGAATTTYTGTTAGTGSVSATVDAATVSSGSITVNAAPSVTSPSSTTVCAGTTATLSATGSGSGTLSYQWYKGTTALTNGATGSGSTIAGATTSTLTITTPGSSDAASNYNVRVSSSTGCAPATSTNATLTVNTLPGISSAPASTTVCAGTTATFSASGSGDGTLSYLWYKGTTALTNGATGTGSTIAGATTATLTITNPGTSDAATNYNVRVSSSTGCTPATSGNVTLTVNPAPSFTAQPTVSPATGICTGSTITLSAGYSNVGSLSASTAQWFRGSSTTPLAVGSTGTGSTVTSITTGTTSASITIANVGAADSLNYILKITSSTGCGGTVPSNPVFVNVSAPTIAAVSTNGTKSIDPTNYVVTNASCTVIAKVQPAGASPISGSTTATVTVQGSVQVYSSNGSPYAPRYYDIVPATNASTATATVTLYYNQSEFTAYNAYPGHGLNLPVDAADAANYKANIRIYQFHGTPNSSGSFPGASTEIIDPVDANIIYNGIYGRWEITFNVTGFSRFYLATAGSTILPLSSIALSGHTDGSTAWLSWKVTGEKDVDHYEVERSIDGSRFTTVGQVAAGSSYVFADQPSDKVVYYYRIKAVDKDGRMAYSSIIAISLKKGGAMVQILPNPFREKLLLNISTTQVAATELRLVDMSGRVLVRKMVTLQVGTNAVALNDLSGLSKGTYQLQVNNNSLHETIKVMKAE